MDMFVISRFECTSFRKSQMVAGKTNVDKNEMSANDKMVKTVGLMYHFFNR